MSLKSKFINRQNVRYLGVFLVAIGVSFSVYYYLSHRSNIVAFVDSTRALKDGELPSEEKPSQADIAQFSVAHDSDPRKLIISRLGISARIIPVEKDKSNTIQSPANIFDVGWLKTSATPLASEGFIVIDGHVQGTSKEGVFKTIDTLKEGDGIILEQQDKQQAVFIVKSIKLVQYDETAETSLLAPAKAGVLELRLITCAGTYLKDKKTYDKRLIVIAQRQ